MRPASRKSAGKVPPKSTKRPPRRKKQTDSLGLNAAKMIDKAFREEIEILVGENKVRCTAFSAIIRQLATKATASHKRAIRVLGRYRDFAATSRQGGFRKVEILFQAPETNR